MNETRQYNTSHELEPPEAVELLAADLGGLHRQHAAGWSVFNRTLQILVFVQTLPWLVAGTIASREDTDLEALTQLDSLPDVLSFTLLFSGLLGLAIFVLLVYNRLNILLYAQALNGYRKYYTEPLKDLRQLMPTDPKVPKKVELTGFMLVVFVTAISISVLYIGIVVANIVSGSAGWICTLLASIGSGVGVFLVALFTYYRIAKGPLIPGWRSSARSGR